jgi:hypothetical protein
MKADSTKSLEQFSELNQAMLGGLLRLNEIMSERLGQFLQLHNAVVNDSLEAGIQYFSGLSDAKRPEEVMSYQMSYLNDSSKKAMDNAKKYLNLALETNAEVKNAFQQNMETVSAKVSPKKAA